MTKQNVSNQALIALQEGKLEEAESLYRSILKEQPEHLDANNNLGIILQNSGKLEEAKEYYKKAIDIKPNFAEAHNNLGGIHIDLGEFKEAEKYYRKALELNPNYVEAHFNLGIVLYKLDKFEETILSYKKAIELKPDHLKAHNNLGVMFYELGNNYEAINYYERAIEINPDDINLINSITNLTRSIDSSNLSKKNIVSYKKLFLFLYQKNNINHNNISANAKSTLLFEKYNDLKKIISSNSPLLKNVFIQNLLKEELFCLMLQKSIIVDVLIEQLLTKVKLEILFTLDTPDKYNLKKYFYFLFSLAEQCWLNEYVNTQSEKEINQIIKLKDKVENDKEINELEITILGCYIPLNFSKIIINKLSDYKSSKALFNNLINTQIKEPLREIELAKSIKSLDEIKDPTSKKVREQYEENPYPRWRYVNFINPKRTYDLVNDDIKPNKISHNNKLDKPNVLIAGSGTGSHPIYSARYKDANILGVDLSLSSLSYAKRKTDELGYTNIEYLHGDILQLRKLNKKFDIIESAGVLHHMNDPVEGLKVLLDILEPHGLLKLALYSEAARRHIVKARELIKKKDLKNTNENIKNFRQDIINKKVDTLIQDVTLIGDFYSTSGARDLLFHVQEHRFTIPQISKILEDLGLEFLGFSFTNQSIVKNYSKSFPDDKANISLNNWHQFEIRNPNTFIGMYQFWAKKV